MELTFTALSRNLLNHPNLALPDGNLGSPYFGESSCGQEDNSEGSAEELSRRCHSVLMACSA